VARLLATFAGFALLAPGVAVAATHTTDFEGLALGSVNGQDGWRSGSSSNQAVVPSGGVPTFGQQSWRLSNLFATENFSTQTYSTPVDPPAGETLQNTVYIARFSFFDPAYQAGLYVTVSPDSGEGSRMAWVSLRDTPDGIEVRTSDSSGTDGAFVETFLGRLSHGQPHTIEWRIKLIPGKANDRVRILIDGEDFGQCFTTWETYYRTDPGQAKPPNNGEPPDLNSLQFRTSVGTPADFATSGYVFDNVTVTTGTGPASPGCDVTIDKQADAPTVSAGGIEGYSITVRNRGSTVARHLRVCDHIPRRTTFVRADHELTQVGRQRCLAIARLSPGQHVSVHLDLRVDANARPGPLANIADITPDVPVLPLPAALGSDLPGPVAAAGTRVAGLKRARAVVKVRARRIRPNFTG
jgi:uncharacterized repeat protein (TIGR01451 family)